LAAQKQFISQECLLECGTHESVAGTGMSEDCEVHVEKRQIDDKGHDYQAESPRRKMLGEMILRHAMNKWTYGEDGPTHHSITLLDIEYVPKVNQHRNSDRKDCEDAIDFGSPCASHEYSSGDEPSPPLHGKLPETTVRVMARQGWRCRTSSEVYGIVRRSRR